MSTVLSAFFLAYSLVGCACSSTSSLVNATTTVRVNGVSPSSTLGNGTTVLIHTSTANTAVSVNGIATSYQPTGNGTTVILMHTSTTPGSNGAQGLKSYEIIIIATCVVVITVLLIIALILCLFRRKRTRRLERENNLSYNNMNYESTVKFRLDKNGEASEQESGLVDSSKKKNNNRQRPGEYEEVNLSKVEKPRKYENVTPDNVVREGSTASAQYENVEPGKPTAGLGATSASPPPEGQYEKVFVDSAPTQGDETKKKYYENVEL